MICLEIWQITVATVSVLVSGFLAPTSAQHSTGDAGAEDSACDGGTLFELDPGPDGRLTHTISQHPYEDAAECLWNVQCTCGMPSVTFGSFNVERSFDYVYVYDGEFVSESDHGRELSRVESTGNAMSGITGSDAPVDPYECSEARTVTIRLQSDSSVAGSGFDATVSCVGGDGCGQIDQVAVPIDADGTTTHGTIESGAGLWYVFVAAAGSTYRFDAQPASNSPLHNSLIRIVASDQTTEVAGTDEESGAAHLEWTCLDSDRYYVEVQGRELETGAFDFTVDLLLIAADPCEPDGAEFRQVGTEVDTIVYEPEAGSYENDLACHWRLTCSCGTPNVLITHLETERGYDFIDIYLGEESWHAAGDGDVQLSGGLHDQVETSFNGVVDSSGGGTMILKFTSDASVAQRGFQADLTCLNGESCIDPCDTYQCPAHSHCISVDPQHPSCECLPGFGRESIHADCTESCDWSLLNDWMRTVDELCCEGEDCQAVVAQDLHEILLPPTCTHSCAEVFVPLFHSCGHHMTSIGKGAVQTDDYMNFADECRTQLQGCELDPCLNGGACEEMGQGSSAECNCPCEYEGRYCETRSDPCSAEPCADQPDTTCVADCHGEYTCQSDCSAGLTGARCNEDVDECALRSNNPRAAQCSANEFCHNLPMTAENPEGYECTTCQPITVEHGLPMSGPGLSCGGIWNTPCMFNPSQPCELGYAPLGTNFQMICMDGGWQGSDGTQMPIQCVDINECLQVICGHGGQCTDSTTDAAIPADQFRCSCQEGWEGETCNDDIDECLNNNGGCDTLTDCSDIEGQFECGPCPNGYTDRRTEVGYAGDSLLSVCRNVNE